MEVTELRIGNLIDFDGQILKVESISNKVVEASGGRCDVRYLKPVRLTEEWFLKFGFMKQNDILGLSDTWWHSGCGFSHVIGNRWSIRNTFNTYVLWVESVHELQNLFFSLNKEELIIS